MSDASKSSTESVTAGGARGLLVRRWHHPLRVLARSNLSHYAMLVGIAVLLLFPIAWMVSTSFKPASELFVSPPVWIPEDPTLEYFRATAGSPIIRRYMLNSVIVAGSTAVIGTALSALAGYALARVPIPGSRLILLVLVSSLMFPQVSLLIPLFRLWSSFGLLNTHIALIATHLTIVMPFGIWLMKGYFDTLPPELEEAAVVDGANRFQVFARISLPLAIPGLIAVGLFSFLLSWDEYLYTFTLVSQDAMRTLPVGMVAQHLSEFAYAWGELMTLSTMISLPILVAFLFFQQYVVEGLTAGSGK